MGYRATPAIASFVLFLAGCSSDNLSPMKSGDSGTDSTFQPDSCSSIAEVCNNQDDDCDGHVDENLGTLTCGTGACARTVPICMEGTPQACPAPMEACRNAIDDDCDGTVDNCASIAVTMTGSQYQFSGQIKDPRATRGSIWIADHWPNPTNPFPSSLNCPGQVTGPWCNVNRSNNTGPSLYQLGDDLRTSRGTVTGLWAAPGTGRFDQDLVVAINASDGMKWICSGADDAMLDCGPVDRKMFGGPSP